LFELLSQQLGLRCCEAAVEIGVALDGFVQPALQACTGRALQPLIFPLGVLLFQMLAQVADLAGIHANRHGAELADRLLHQGVEPLLDVALKLAHLFRFDRALCQSGRACQQVGIEGELALAVPALQPVKRFSHPGALAVVEIELPIEPPIGQRRALLVTELDGAATCERQRTQQGQCHAPLADNP